MVRLLLVASRSLEAEVANALRLGQKLLRQFLLRLGTSIPVSIYVKSILNQLYSKTLYVMVIATVFVPVAIVQMPFV